MSILWTFKASGTLLHVVNENQCHVYNYSTMATWMRSIFTWQLTYNVFPKFVWNSHLHRKPHLCPCAWSHENNTEHVQRLSRCHIDIHCGTLSYPLSTTTWLMSISFLRHLQNAPNFPFNWYFFLRAYLPNQNVQSTLSTGAKTKLKLFAGVI
jgi:hypothetical protein